MPPKRTRKAKVLKKAEIQELEDKPVIKKGRPKRNLAKIDQNL